MQLGLIDETTWGDVHGDQEHPGRFSKPLLQHYCGEKTLDRALTADRVTMQMKFAYGASEALVESLEMATWVSNP